MDSTCVEHTHGFFRRLLIIPFTQTIGEHEQDRDLHKKILANRAGILNWIIEGAEQVIKNRNIFISDECEQFKMQFIKDADSVAMFEEQFILENLRGTFYFRKVIEAHHDYKNYCSDAGYKALGRTNFSKRMESIGFEKVKQETGWHLRKNYG